MKSFLEYIKNNQHVRYIVGTGIVIVCTGSLWLGFRDNAYALSVDGEVIAVVKEKEMAQGAYEKVVETLKQDAGVDIAVHETLSIEPVHSSKKEMRTEEELRTALEQAVTYDVAAYEILVDGKGYAVVESKEAAEEILANIAKKYLPETGDLVLATHALEEETESKETGLQVETTTQEEVKATEAAKEEVGSGIIANTSNETTHAEVVLEQNNDSKKEVIEVADALPEEEKAEEIHVGEIQVEGQVEQADTQSQKIEREMQTLDFNETVTIKNVYVPKEDILTAEVAMDVLLSNTEEIVEYELKEGDNIWDIAVKNGTTMAHILEINPQIKDETKMQIGEVIKLEVPDPILSISTTENSTFKELIPAEIQYVWFSHFYEDQTAVYRDGSDGLKEITVAVNKVNGKEVSRTQISEKMISEPVIKVIAYGTKKRPVEPEVTTNSTSNSTKKQNAGSSVSSSSSGTFMHPLNGAGSLSSGYGYRWSAFHSGLDFAASAGTPIYASASGEVIYSTYNNGGYGKLVIIDHGNGYQTYYAHCSSLYVNVGQRVSKGQNIAAVGSTGDSTGNHVHFEIRKNGTPVNPYNYLY